MKKILFLLCFLPFFGKAQFVSTLSPNIVLNLDSLKKVGYAPILSYSDADNYVNVNTEFKSSLFANDSTTRKYEIRAVFKITEKKRKSIPNEVAALQAQLTALNTEYQKQVAIINDLIAKYNVYKK